MVIDMNYWMKVIKRIIFLAFSIVALCFLVKLSIFYLPFLIAFLIASIVEPLVKKVAKHTKLERKISAIIVLILFSAILIGLIILGITSLISESSNLLQGLNEYTSKIYNWFQYWMDNFNLEKFKLPEQVFSVIQNSLQDLLSVASNWIKTFLTAILQTITAVPTISVYVVITLLATYFICTDRLYILDQLEHHFPMTWLKRIRIHFKEISSSLGNYLKAQATLISIDFIEVVIGLYILKYIGMNIEFPLLAAIGIGFVDALPIFGAGAAIIPWAIISGINGNINMAIGLLVILLIISVIRQFLEPKIVSKKIGIHPIFTLIGMYTGFKLIGIFGLLIGPIAIIILKNIYGTFLDRGVFKTILDRK